MMECMHMYAIYKPFTKAMHDIPPPHVGITLSITEEYQISTAAEEDKYPIVEFNNIAYLNDHSKYAAVERDQGEKSGSESSDYSNQVA